MKFLVKRDACCFTMHLHGLFLLLGMPRAQNFWAKIMTETNKKARTYHDVHRDFHWISFIVVMVLSGEVARYV